MVHGGTPTVGAVGVDPHTQARLTTTDRFRIESLTKSFVGALALQLVQQGRLHLDDPVSTYMSDWPRGDEITIRMLLSHTSGIPPWGGDRGGHDLYSDAADQFAVAHYGKTVSPQEVLDVARTRPLLFEPGTATSYSNVNTILLGQIVTQLTGRALGDALHEALLDPLHLTATSYAPTETTTPIGGFTDLGGDGKLVDTGALDWTGDVSTNGAAGGMVSSVPDLLTWGNAFLRERSVVTDLLANDAFSIRAGGTGLGVLGFDHEQFFCVFADSGCTAPTAFTTIGGAGAGPGVRTILAYNRDTDAVAVVMVNRDSTPGIEELVRDTFDDVARLEQARPTTSN
jgi:D-alanyl-D-alanine carboxypeptidase